MDETGNCVEKKAAVIFTATFVESEQACLSDAEILFH